MLLRLQDARLRQRGQRGVVLVLGASPWQRDALRRELRRIDPAIRQRASAAVGAGGSARAAGGPLFLLGLRGCAQRGVCPPLHPPPTWPRLGATCPGRRLLSQHGHAAAACPLNPTASRRGHQRRVGNAAPLRGPGPASLLLPRAHANPPHVVPVLPSCVLPAAAFEVPAEVTNEVPAAERQALYSTASCLFVTTRILVVDQLSGRITADQVAGMIVLNAHR